MEFVTICTVAAFTLIVGGVAIRMARRGITWSALRLFAASLLGLILTIRMNIFDNNRGFVYLFFPALMLLGTNAFLGLRSYYRHSLEGQA